MISRNLMLGAAALCLAAISPAALAAVRRRARRGDDAGPAVVRQVPGAPLEQHLRARPPGWDPRQARPQRAAAHAGGSHRAARGRPAGRRREGRYFVFLEDVRTQQTTKMRVGDPVCAGKLVNPTLDSVEYLKNGVAKRIEVGENLTGKEAATPAPRSTGRGGQRRRPDLAADGAGRGRESRLRVAAALSGKHRSNSCDRSA